MTPPNMAAITASLERSLQSFSLSHRTATSGDTGDESTTTHCHRSATSSDATLELNSDITLPHHWEQILDLKTGEVYFINWKTGMKSKEDPRLDDDRYIYTEDDEEDEEEEEEEEGVGLYADDSESSSVESSPAASSPAASSSGKQKQKDDKDEGESRISGHVLVVAGCKGCFMYFMVPKQVEDCPKCCGQLLHFDRSDDH